MSGTHHTVDPKFTYFDKRIQKDVVRYIGLLDAAHRAGLVAIETEILAYPCEENERTCIVRATVVFERDPERPLRITAIGDANPKNVGAAIAPHFIRMAETRAKARALRDALNIGMVAVEELGGDEDREAAPPPGNPAPNFTRPRETRNDMTPELPRSMGPEPAPEITDDQLLAEIRDDTRDPDMRWNALWDYYAQATTVADLNLRAERVKASGIPTRDLKAAYRQMHDRLAQAFAPAGIAG